MGLRGIDGHMRLLRLVAPALAFVAVTFVFAELLWLGAVAAEVFVFGGETPECKQSDSCGWFGDIVYTTQDSWLAYGAWLCFCGLLLIWPFRWVLRSNRPIREELRVPKG
jgi:hypothetical protein